MGGIMRLTSAVIYLISLGRRINLAGRYCRRLGYGWRQAWLKAEGRA